MSLYNKETLVTKSLLQFYPYFNSGLFGCSYCNESRIIYTNKEEEEASGLNMIQVNVHLFTYCEVKKQFILELPEYILPPTGSIEENFKVHWTDYSIYCNNCNEWTMQFEKYLIGELMLEFIRMQVEVAKKSYSPIAFTSNGLPNKIGYYGEPIRWQNLIIGFSCQQDSKADFSNFSGS